MTLRLPARLRAPFISVSTNDRGTLFIEGAPVGRPTHHRFERYMHLLLAAKDEAPKADFIAYKLSQSVNVWLAGLPAHKLTELLDREGRTEESNPSIVYPVRYDGWRFDYLPDHFFSVQFGARKIRIHDVWRFFGRPLDAALAHYGVDTLEELMESFRAGCIDAGVIPRAWEGPGAGASVLLQRWGVRDSLVWPPDPVLTAARYAYAAHRFEVILPGEHPRAWHYDIRAAYPWAAAQIPDWRAGAWARDLMAYSVPGVMAAGSAWSAWSGPTSLYRVRWDCPRTGTLARFGPFPWRYANGELCFPLTGQGWVWGCELAAAVRIWGPGPFSVDDGWVFYRLDADSPWLQSQETWPLRSIFPPVKKFLNACPGKLAQAWPRPGPYFHPPSAGLVTALVRSRMLRLMAEAGGDLVAVLGDGIMTKRPMPWPTGDQPGELAGAELHDLLIVQPSVYFCGAEVSAKDDNAHAFGDTDAAFWAAWRQSGMDGEVEIPFRHQTSIAEGLASGATIGDWVTASQSIGFGASRRRRTGRYVQSKRTGAVYNITTALPAPDPIGDLVTVPGQRWIRGQGDSSPAARPADAGLRLPPAKDGAPDPALPWDHSHTFWDAELRPMAPPVEPWPGSGDEIGG